MKLLNENKDYVSVVYNEKDRPFTEYPYQLARYLKNRYGLKANEDILDLGCGRGEFLRGFVRCGLNGYGIDQSRMAEIVCPKADIRTANMEQLPLPFENDRFDTVFSKSVLEHFYYPEKLIAEIYRILKPGGLVITMVPDWESIYKTFYEDYTHRTPFTRTSLKDILLMNGFLQVSVEKFMQLPFLWKWPFLRFFCVLLAKVAPRSLRQYVKLVRFSQEVMLLSTAVKPKNQGR